jgi:diadenylate cyclase
MRDVQELELMNLLKMMAPGTMLREGLENVLKAKTGGLIVIGEQDEVMKTVDGGFFINSEYTPSYIYELAKMDGALILSSDLKRILYANTQLIPDSSIQTSETGTRHRTAERVAKQTGNLVIAISERRNIITVYKGNIKYMLRDTNIILTKANQAIQTLERYKVVLDEVMTNLSALEFEDLVTVYDVAMAVQRSEMVMRIVYEIERYISELGDEGRLVSMQLDDLIDSVEEDEIHLIRDYTESQKDYNDVVKVIKNISSDELIELSAICKVLGYSSDSMLDTMISSRGSRLLNKIPRVPQVVIENMFKTFGYLKNVLNASIEELDAVEGIGEARARAIKERLRKMQEQVILNRPI